MNKEEKMTDIELIDYLIENTLFTRTVRVLKNTIIADIPTDAVVSYDMLSKIVKKTGRKDIVLEGVNFRFPRKKIIRADCTTSITDYD